MFFSFPDDARWDSDRCCVAFGIAIGEYEGVVRVYRRAFQSLLNEGPTPERCLEAYYLHRTRLERIAERKIRRRQRPVMETSRSRAAISANGSSERPRVRVPSSGLL